MKKAFLSIFVISIIVFMLIIPTSAATLDGDAQKSAEALKELNLFQGTPNGFELERPMTRAEAAAMLVRFLGAEKTAMNGNFKHPFTDVPEWADGYVGWLYQSGLTKGVSKTLYGASQPVTAWQYATFITRALNDHETIMPSLITEEEINAIDSEKKFIRADAAILSVRALGETYTKNGNWRPFADVCIERKLFTAEKFGEALYDFISSEYSVDSDGHIVRRMLGIEVKKTVDGDYITFEAIDPIATDGTKYDPFLYKYDGKDVTIYTMNPKTLEVKEFIKRENMSSTFIYLQPFKLGETLFLFEGDKDKRTLLAIKGQKVDEVISFTEKGWYARLSENILLDADSALVMTDKKYFVITENGYTEIGEANLSLISYIDGEVIAKRINDKSVDILLLDAKTGNEKISYNIPDDIERGQYGEGFRDLDREYEKYRYGEAGLYYHDGKTLIQVTDRPVNGFIPENDGSFVILTHKPGKRISGQVHFGGNEIMRISADGVETYLTREDTPFSIDGIFKKDGKVCFTTATGVGMGNYDVFAYRIEENGKFTVIDFNAGRPEMMNGYTTENPDGYKKAYIEAEQKRIEALGY